MRKSCFIIKVKNETLTLFRGGDHVFMVPSAEVLDAPFQHKVQHGAPSVSSTCLHMFLCFGVSDWSDPALQHRGGGELL